MKDREIRIGLNQKCWVVYPPYSPELIVAGRLFKQTVFPPGSFDRLEVSRGKDGKVTFEFRSLDLKRYVIPDGLQIDIEAPLCKRLHFEHPDKPIDEADLKLPILDWAIQASAEEDEFKKLLKAKKEDSAPESKGGSDSVSWVSRVGLQYVESNVIKCVYIKEANQTFPYPTKSITAVFTNPTNNTVTIAWRGPDGQINFSTHQRNHIIEHSSKMRPVHPAVEETERILEEHKV